MDSAFSQNTQSGPAARILEFSSSRPGFVSSSIENSRSVALKKMLSAGPQIPPERFRRTIHRTSEYLMPDDNGTPGRMESMKDPRISLPAVFAVFALGGGIAILALLLGMAFKAAHIPIP